MNREPISNTDLDVAVIGMAIRAPGARNTREYWHNLVTGVESITFFEAEELEQAGMDPDLVRRPDYVRAASMLDGIADFDAELFGYSPREAATLDPQCRVFLETCWEALEDAGIRPRRGDSAIGLWASQSLPMYLLQRSELLDFDDFVLGAENVHLVLGNALDFLATRVAYRLDLTGPCLTVQSACSSSLVAVHLARQSLLNGECDVALAGGVSIYLPQKCGYRHREGLILSPDGHCRPFDAAAAGTIFGRGAGVVVLKRIGDAVADGDAIRAVVKGTAVNNSGSRAAAYTAPSVRGEARVISEALADAGVSARSIGFVEAHGTGTPQGDPIEITALTQAFRQHTRDRQFCLIGSVKSNFGHLDVAAGVAGFIKAVMVLEQGLVPPTLNFERPNPEIDFENSPFCVNTGLAQWPSTEELRRAGVSAFGFGGTNAHVILEEAPRRSLVEQTDRTAHVLCLSGRTDESVARLAARFAARVRELGAPPGDLAYSVNTGRAVFNRRVAVTFTDNAELAGKLDALGKREFVEGAFRSPGEDDGGSQKLAFLFTGQGAQRSGMARRLFETQPVFRKVLEECDALLRPRLERPLLSVLYPEDPGDAELLNQTEYTQPALFAIEYGLACLWRSWGIEPHAVAGHSLGEFVAACVAGVYDLAEGLDLVTTRGKLVRELAADGAMAAILADEDCVREAIAPYPDSVSIAALNGPLSTVISGRRDAVGAIVADLRARGTDVRELPISSGFHSALVEPVLDAFEERAARIAHRAPHCAVVSNLRGGFLEPGSFMDGRYWREHMRSPVRFFDSMQALRASGYTHFLEIGPHPVLLGMAMACFGDEYGVWLPSLHRDRDDWTQLVQSLARLWADGASVNWEAFDVGFPRKRVPALPTYPFERGRHWIDATRSAKKEVRTEPSSSVTHPLRLERLASPALRQPVVQAWLDPARLPVLTHHRIGGRTLVPAVLWLECLVEGATACGMGAVGEVEDLLLLSAVDPGRTGARAQLVMSASGGNEFSFEAFSAPEDVRSLESWTRCATGRALVRAGRIAVGQSLDEVRARCSGHAGGDGLYEELHRRGYDYGEAFRGVRELWYGDAEVVSRIEATPFVQGDTSRFRFHPALLDACLHAALPVCRERATGAPSADLFLPIGIARIALAHLPLSAVLWSHARFLPSRAGADSYECDITIYDADHRVVMRLERVSLKKADAAALDPELQRRIGDSLYRVDWVPAEEYDTGVPRLAAQPRQLGADAQARLQPLRDVHGMEVYTEIAPALDSLCTAYVANACRKLGWQPAVGEVAQVDVLRRRLGVTERHAAMFGRMVEILAEDGILVRRGDYFEATGALPASDVADRLEALLRSTSPRLRAMIELVARCGKNLAGVLQGLVEPLELLFPGGSLTDLGDLYSSSAFATVYNELVAGIVANVLEDRRAPLRVLEIGAGTGGTASCVLPRLSPTAATYTYTDISGLFLAQARKKFADYGFVRYATLDVERPLPEQGFENESFDVVIASNVLHATEDLRRAVRHVRGAMTRGGLLVLVEGIAKQRWVDIIFGLTEGWWKSTDGDLRGTYPLIGQDAWCDLLTECGFGDAVAIPGAGREHEIFSQSVIVARADGTPGLRTGRTADVDARHWLVLADAAGVGDDLADYLRDRGDRCTVAKIGSEYCIDGNEIRFNPDVEGQFSRLLADVGRESTGRRMGIAYLWPLDACEVNLSSGSVLDAVQQRSLRGALHLVQALAGAQTATPTRLWIVTRGSQPVGDADVPGLAASPLWGMRRVVALEHPELECTAIDLDPYADVSETTSLASVLRGGGAEQEQAVRAGQVWVPRLCRLESPEKAALVDRSQKPAGDEAEPVRLCIDEPGVLDSLRLKPDARRAPGVGEVEIRVHSMGLNFKDVLAAFGRYPGDAGPLGNECAGVVERVGARVVGLQPGDEVVAFAPGSLATFVIADARLVAHKPRDFTFEQAATTVGAFVTAQYALSHVARISARDHVLIHSGAGGVGMAAIQLAKRAGATVYATAGTADKRRLVRRLGVRLAMSSRDAEFVEEVRVATEDRGADVVLNSLTGELARASLAVTAEGGRFVELGKIDTLDADESAGLRGTVAFRAIDVAADAVSEPDVVGAILAEIVAMFVSGELRPLPLRVFPIDRAVEAFRHMAGARHIGKIVLRNRVVDRKHPAVSKPDADALSGAHVDSPLAIRADATYLVAGGFGGLGLLFAEWLVDRGAQHLALVGRRRPGAEAEAAIARLRERGARIAVRECDIGDERAVDACIAELATAMPPMRGVIQAAGSLDDGVLVQQSWHRFLKVMGPKVSGSWALHRATQFMPLDFFVFFSSVASLLGSAGQANHAAANAFMDALAFYRRARGLAAVSINWGPWSEVGAAARLRVNTSMPDRGIHSIGPADGLRAFEQIVGTGLAQVAAVRVDWRKYTDRIGDVPFLRAVAVAGESSPSTPAPAAEVVDDVAARMAAAPSRQRRGILRDFVLQHAARGLGIDAASLDPRRPLSELGLDSLLAIELRTKLASGIKRSLPATLLFDRPSVDAVTDYLAGEVLTIDVHPSTAQADAGRDERAVLEEVLAMSEEEAEALLMQELDRSTERR